MNTDKSLQLPSRYTAPVVGTDGEPSMVPALWGIRSMKAMRVLIDLVNMQLHICGPGDVRVDAPPGTTSIAIEESMSKHPLLPCTDFDRKVKSNVQGRALSFQTSSY